MATNGVLPKRFSASHFTVCSACLYGKVTKRPSNNKTVRYINEYKLVVSGGNCIYVDVLVSRNPGLITQMSGFIMHQHYHYTYVFIDHHSDFTYLNLLKYQNVDTTQFKKRKLSRNMRNPMVLTLKIIIPTMEF